MDDLISRAKAIEAIDEIESEIAEGFGFEYEKWRKYFCDLPPAQPEQTEMIKEIRKWINSANRGNTDYFIVDKIEEIINRYE